MANAKRREQPRRRLSLSVRFSLLVLFAALLPLAAVVAFNDYNARNTLVQQGQSALKTDAKTNTDQAALYLRERMEDGGALGTLPTTPAYLLCVIASQLPPEQAQQALLINEKLNCSDPVVGADFYKGSNQRALCVGLQRDAEYTLFSLATANGTSLLSYAPTGDPKHPCTPTASPLNAPKEDLARVQQGTPFISAVYYDTAGKFTYVNLYTPIPSPLGANQVIGFIQARLRLDYIAGIVAGEKDANGSGSGAFITDENGVRIATSNPADLFSSVTPLDAATQQLIASEQRFGPSSSVQQDTLPEVASALKASTDSSSFQGIATPGSKTLYQFTRVPVKVVIRNAITGNPNEDIHLNWSYFNLSPLSTVTAVADDQVRTSLFGAAIIAILAILLGLVVGTRTARPVSAAAGDLQGAAVELKLLATRQQNSAGEQQWVVDACKTGLESVRYLSDAMNQAARRIIDASNWFGEYWDRLTEDQARKTVQHLLELARYVDEAARRQQASSDRLGKAITVTMQVSDQLAAGADAATRSADQLEQVVGNLQHVIGGRHFSISEAVREAEEHMEQMDPMSQMGQMGQLAPVPQVPALAAAPMRAAHPGQLGSMSAPNLQRQLAAPMPQASDPWGRQGRPSQVAPGWGERPMGRPGQSQVFSGGLNGYNGYNPGPNGGYGESPQQDPWASAQQGRRSWDDR